MVNRPDTGHKIYQGDRIELIEIYFKGDKENEDRERIRGRFRLDK